MASYRLGVAGAAPLRIQLGTAAMRVAEVHRLTASGENATGTASRPTLSRPAVPGTGTAGTIVSLDGHSTPTSTGITSFSGAPSTPSVTTGNFNLPVQIDFILPPGRGIVVLPSSFILWYASASGGHTWQGEIEFEEL